MKEFFVLYYKEIIAIFCFILEFFISIIILIKKNKKDSGVIGSIVLSLPDIINRLESEYGAKSGTTKKVKALDLCLELYKKMTGISLSYDSAIADIFSKAIESVLSTPQKKS